MHNEEALVRLKQELEIRNFSKKTVNSYIHSVNQFLNYAAENELSQQKVKDYVQLKISTKNPSTINHDIFAIQFFFDKVLNQKIYVPRPKKNKILPVILTLDEAKKLVNAPANIKHKLMLKLLYGCGLRAGKVINIKKQT
jgi:site-specific recombinase XerD